MVAKLVGAGGVTALVIRRDLTVVVEPLAAGTAALLAALHRNRTLAEALAAALAVQADLDLATVLADHMRRGTIVRAQDEAPAGAGRRSILAKH